MNRREWRDAWRNVRLGHDVPRAQWWIVHDYRERESEKMPPHRKPGDRGRMIRSVLNGLPLTTPWFFYPIPLP